MTRQYYGIENLGLNATQKQTLIDAFRQLGANQHPNPSHRNHWRTRLDNDAVIFEGQFDDSDWTVDMIKNRLATIFDIDVSLIGDDTQQTQYGPVITFSRNGDRLRMIAFGGLLATWEESHDAVLDYINNNSPAWGG